MRIDDENKVVYVDKRFKDELFKLKEYNGISKLMVLQNFSGKFGVPTKMDDDKWKKISEAVFNDYKFKLEQPKKYYWCKKKEHMVWFEVAQDTYLAQDEDDGELTLGWLEGAGWKCKFTETEARNLLKDDFDKFEKVECE